jgi:hypothetical protein
MEGVSGIMEKRASKRHGCEASITCGYFNGNEASSAKMLNCSEDGAYLESASFFKERSIVLIRLKQISSGIPEPEICYPPQDGIAV